MEDKKILMSVEQLSFAYPKSALLFEDLNVNILSGKITTLLGQNGCGKSTLLYLLSKNQKPNKGKIFYEGIELEALKGKDFAKKVAIVHQKNTAPLDLLVEELIGYGRCPHQGTLFRGESNHDKQMIERAMRLTGTLDLRKRTIGSLSGGQLQRVWIGMALAQETPTILLDEPTTYLDIKYQIEIMQLIQRLNEEEKMSIVMVLHDINQALHYSHQIVAMKSGKIEAVGESELFYNEARLQKIYDIHLPVIGHQIVKTF